MPGAGRKVAGGVAEAVLELSSADQLGNLRRFEDELSHKVQLI